LKAELKIHPAATKVRLMTETELEGLVADIRDRGQVHPIIVHEGQILDGRNRLAACKLAGVEPWFQEWDGRGRTPTGYAISANIPRRHLTQDQLAMAAADAIELFEAEAAERRRAGAQAGGAKKNARTPAKASALPPNGGKAERERAPTAAAQSAAAHGVSPRQVERAKELKTKRPDLAEQIRDNKNRINKALKTVKREEQIAEVKAYVPPVGEHAVISIDPPWSFTDKLDGSDQVRGGCPYPDMSIAEIAALDIPVAKDCAVFLWVTNSHLIDPDAYPVVVRAWRDRYGLVPKQIRTWVKTKMGVGHVWRNDTEHLVRLERGKPVFNPVTQTTHFVAPAGEHSTKPELAYTEIELLCASSSRLEMFARRERAGWSTFGSEIEKPSTKSRGKLGPGDRARLEAMVRPEAEPASDEAIAWRPQKGDGMVAIGKSKGRSWSIRTSERVDGLGYFWHSGASSSKLFDTERQAKTDAAQQEWLWQSEELDDKPTPDPKSFPVTQCGAADGHPGPKNGPCLLDAGHEGAHSNGRRTWPGKKPRALKGKPTRPNMQVRDV
jgi:N6-adenosine-specific RNA methylase IME4